MKRYTAVIYYYENNEYCVTEETRFSKESALAWINTIKEYADKKGIHIIGAEIETHEIEKIF